MSFNSQMTTLADTIRAKANITGGLSISGMIAAINGLTAGEDIDITLGEVDQYGNFQPVSFDGTSAIASGSPISVSAYYTWNNSSFSYAQDLERSYSGDLDVTIILSNESIIHETVIYSGVSQWTYSEESLIITIDESENQSIPSIWFNTGANGFGLYLNQNTLIPLGVNLAELTGITYHEQSDIFPTSIIINKAN